jgi:hypothetical protein
MPLMNLFYSLYLFSKIIYPNKCFEFQVYYSSDTILALLVSAEMSGVDHAGVRIEITLFGLSVLFHLYDIRHWDYDNKRWCEYD